MATDDECANPEQAKVTSIREGTPEKAELLKLFEVKKWDRAPPENKDKELEALMQENKWNQSQSKCHLSIWKCLGANMSKYLD
jgi:hypothetical protein